MMRFKFSHKPGKPLTLRDISTTVHPLLSAAEKSG